jgi:acetoacetyl-CoA synthetase
MWYWLVTAVAAGATAVLWDGSPFHPGVGSLFEMAAEEGVTHFGTSPAYLERLRKERFRPREHVALPDLRAVLSTGSPLPPAAYDQVHRDVKRDVCLSSISGGTEVMACFATGNPTGPVHRGELQAPALGMQTEIFDDSGRPLARGAGELVCTRPFPSLPLGFWDDPDGRRYRAAYFERFPGVWHHGDWAERTRSGGFVIHGRSDATLKPGGVRIGTAELYRPTNRLEEVLDSLAVAQEWGDDVRVVLFVKLQPGLRLDAALEARIRAAVREAASPRHVPAVLVQVDDVPYTRTGKLAELAVRDLIHGRPVRNRAVLRNPESLRGFVRRPELSGVPGPRPGRRR